MFENNRSKFPKNPLEFVNCKDYKEIFKILEINVDNLADKWMKFFSSTLNTNPNERSTIKELINLMQLPVPVYNNTHEKFLRTKCYENINSFYDEDFFKIDNFIDIHEFYYLWSVSCPSKETDKLEEKIPIILSIPRLVILESDCSNNQDSFESNKLKEDDDLVARLLKIDFNNLKLIKLPSNCDFKFLPVETINERLLKLSNEIFSPVLTFSDTLTDDKYSKQHVSLPISIREMDFDYQCERIFLFKALLNGIWVFIFFNYYFIKIIIYRLSFFTKSACY